MGLVGFHTSLPGWDADAAGALDFALQAANNRTRRITAKNKIDLFIIFSFL